MLKKITYSLLILAMTAFTTSVAVAPPAAAGPAEAAAPAFPTDMAASVDEFLELTPKKFREMTGKKLSFKETIGLKMAQKKVKSEMRKAKKGKRDTIPVAKGLFIVFAIFIPIVAVIMMGLASDWQGNNWWIALLLYFACYLPGLIYTLVKMKDYNFE